LIVMENFFTYNAIAYHEIGLYFAMTFPTDSPILQQEAPFDGMEHFFGTTPLRLIFEWTPLNHLSEKELKPASLNRALLELQNLSYPLHLIEDDSGLSR
ncbi:MAG TPA: hypothetical protein VHL11_13185, partial [Phototrophicaceae bacterium]|nr:hypothetical protein [Phototrophicaceae bacterium]